MHVSGLEADVENVLKLQVKLSFLDFLHKEEPPVCADEYFLAEDAFLCVVVPREIEGHKYDLVVELAFENLLKSCIGMAEDSVIVLHDLAIVKIPRVPESL